MMNFKEKFKQLTGNDPFPWQEELYNQFKLNNIPTQCAIPTGLGKTSIIAVWLIALAEKVNVPRRLVYVVNRRTVVDQTTAEAERIRENANKIGVEGLRISTLRGQYADNREWSADPSKPAIICGTVDMIGSRLLFSGYRCGFKTKPLHAGFLGLDALLIHDESHLEPAFQQLIESIRNEQERENTKNPWPNLTIMSLSATTRENNGTTGSFTLTDEEKNPPDQISNQPTEPIHHVWARLHAKKIIELKKVNEKKKIAEEIAKIALEYKDQKARVLIYVREIDAIKTICDKLKNQKVLTLTGTLRGKERDELFRKPDEKDHKQDKSKEKPLYWYFLKDTVPVDEVEKTVYLVCTSAGEVGIDISADHLICDLTPFDSMAQRFGRVNRYGHNYQSNITVVHSASITSNDQENKKAKEKEKKVDKYGESCIKTLELLEVLNGDASPYALMNVDPSKKQEAFTPTPTILPATDILFDAWSMTTIRKPLPGRPPVEPYLHGIRDWEPPETHVAWREEVGIMDDKLLQRYKPEDLQEDYPLKPHELLRDRSDRILKELKKIAERNADLSVWVIDSQGNVEPKTLNDLTSGDNKKNVKFIEWKTILLSPNAGGLKDGFLDGKEDVVKKADVEKADVADHWYEGKDNQTQRRMRIWDHELEQEVVKEAIKKMRLIRTIDTKPDTENDVEESKHRFWYWYVRPYSSDDDLSESTTKEVILLDDHTESVCKNAIEFTKKKPEIEKAVVFAAKYHDLGKKRKIWQQGIGNTGNDIWAKSGSKKRKLNTRSNYRHELGSILDILNPCDDNLASEFNELSEEQKDIALHLIAAHHGYARPHFPAKNAIDPEYPEKETNEVVIEATRRFARLQRKYGRWGLAYLESLLRAADYAASANPNNNDSNCTNQSDTPEVPS